MRYSAFKGLSGLSYVLLPPEGVPNAAARKLGLSDPEDAYTMDRPKGMHERTFQRLRQDVIGAIEREEWAFEIVVRKFARTAR
jgi:hypothetical protein